MKFQKNSKSLHPTYQALLSKAVEETNSRAAESELAQQEKRRGDSLPDMPHKKTRRGGGATLRHLQDPEATTARGEMSAVEEAIWTVLSQLAELGGTAEAT